MYTHTFIAQQQPDYFEIRLFFLIEKELLAILFVRPFLFSCLLELVCCLLNSSAIWNVTMLFCFVNIIRFIRIMASFYQIHSPVVWRCR